LTCQDLEIQGQIFGSQRGHVRRPTALCVSSTTCISILGGEYAEALPSAVAARPGQEAASLPAPRRTMPVFGLKPLGVVLLLCMAFHARGQADFACKNCLFEPNSTTPRTLRASTFVAPLDLATCHNSL
jgi:hypothetical protein